MLEIRMLGPLEVLRDGLPVPIRGRLPRLVLGRLLVSAGRPVAADALLEDVWHGAAPSTARKSVQKYVSELRRQLGPAAIRTSAAGYALDVPSIAVDAGEFEALVSSGAFADALSLWRGEPLVDLGEPEYLLAERLRLEDLRLHALEQSFAQAIDDGRSAAVLPELADVAAANPLREGLTRLHMLGLYRAGRHVDALRVFDLHRRTLAEDVGVEPGNELRDLEAAILRHDPALGPAAAHPTGRHEPGRAVRGNLPVSLSSFVGREREVEAALGLLQHNRLVCLVGPGGIGKTRLGLEVGERLAGATPGGVWFVDLGPVLDDALIADTIAAAMAVDVREAGDALAAVIARLRSQPPSVLLLDNCEHLAQACAEVVAVLLRACPGLTVLATSRRPLGVDGEYVSPVPPLPHRDGRALLLDRADRLGAGLDLEDGAQSSAVASICNATDGLPLAIELVASQLRVVAPGELEARLADRLRFQGSSDRQRQRNLHDMVAWSYDLVGLEARHVFDRLGVFVSSFTLEAAEDVAATSTVGQQEVLLQMTALVDHSLVTREYVDGHSRYRLLETLRLFAVGRLDATGGTANANRAHACYYLGLATRAGRHLYGREEVTWKRLLDAEQPNLHAALRWTAQHEPELAFELAVALWPYWDVRWGERHAVTYLDDLLARHSGQVPEGLFAWGLTVAADLAANPGDARRSTAWAEQAVVAFRQIGDDVGLQHALVALGSSFGNQARLDDADAALAEAIDLGERHADRVGLARALNIASIVASRRGDHDAAYRTGRAELELWSSLDSGRGQAVALRHLAVAQWSRGELTAADALCQQALALWATLDDPVAVAHLHTTLADIDRVRGNLIAARERYEQALTVLQSVGDRRCTASTFKNLGHLAVAEGDHDGALSLLRQALVLRHELGDTPGLAECLEGMALVSGHTGDHERAARLLFAASAIRCTNGTPTPPREAPLLADALATAAAALSDEQLAAAEAYARSVTPEAVVASFG